MTEHKPWWKARGVLVSAGFFAFLAVAFGAVTAFTGGHHDPEAATTPSHPVGATTPIYKTVPGCQLPSGDQHIPLAQPAAHWDKIGTAFAPGSSVAGPALRNGHVRTCYQHSPTGAVFAAYGFVVAQLQYPGDTKMLKALTAPSEVRDQALAHGGSPPVDPAWSLKPVAFRVIDYSPASATVRIAIQAIPTIDAVQQGGTSSRLGTADARFLWQEGDWKYVAEADRAHTETIDSLAGLVPWGAP